MPPRSPEPQTAAPAAESSAAADAAWKRWLFWAALTPLRIAPRWLRYRISDGLALVLRHGLAYRKRVIDDNLRIAFPDKSDAERRALRFAFYRNFADLILEQVWAFGARPAEVLAMFEFEPGVCERFAAYRHDGRAVMVAAGHHNNYELGAAALGLAIEMPLAVIYARLVDPFFDARVRESRARFGMELWPRGRTAERVADYRARHASFAVGFAFDQSPSATRPKYWLPFFGRETAVQQGLDFFARAYASPVVFMWAERLARGRYRIHADFVCDDASVLEPGVATERATAALERAIRRDPAGWMWSHRRWKLDPTRHRIPADTSVAASSTPPQETRADEGRPVRDRATATGEPK